MKLTIEGEMMVQRNQWGELQELLDEYNMDYLSELCYILGVNKGRNKNKRIGNILRSEYDYQYIVNRLTFLVFGLNLHDYYTNSELSEIIKEYGLQTHRSKWDKLVEIIASEIITPRTLLGSLSTEQLIEFYFDVIQDDFTSTELSRETLIREIINSYNLKWLESITNKGFIMMPISKDKDLMKVYQIIKDEAMKFDINAERIDEMASSNRITIAILEKIKNSEYFFVDLTNERPNVYYELGYLHGLEMSWDKIILMARTGTKLHFDIKDLNTIIYKNSNHFRKELVKRLKQIV